MFANITWIFVILGAFLITILVLVVLLIIKHVDLQGLKEQLSHSSEERSRLFKENKDHQHRMERFVSQAVYPAADKLFEALINGREGMVPVNQAKEFLTTLIALGSNEQVLRSVQYKLNQLNNQAVKLHDRELSLSLDWTTGTTNNSQAFLLTWTGLEYPFSLKVEL